MSMNMIGLTTAVLTLLVLFFIWYGRYRHQRLLATVKVVTLEGFESAHLDNQRDILLYLPPSYRQSNNYYPTLFLNDGQDVGQLRLHETLARLFAHKAIRELVVVAIPTNDDRLHEYGTAVAPNAQNLGTKASAYDQFITQELLPKLQDSFRLLDGAENRAILGASLGGLSAFDISWNHPDLFGSVGVFSGSFWWRAGEEATAVAPNQLIAHEIVRNGRCQPGQRFWFEAGTRDERDDRDNNGVIDAIQDTLELIEELEKLGYQSGTDITYLQVEGGRHNYHTWSAILPDFLRWAFSVTE